MALSAIRSPGILSSGISKSGSLATLTANREALARASQSDDAVRISLSAESKGAERSSVQAIRQISNATSYISIGRSAVDAIDSLLAQAATIAEEIEDTVDPNRKSALASEGASLISSIDTVVSRATFQDEGVINSGVRRFATGTSNSISSVESDRFLSVANIAADRASLGVATVTNAHFITSPDTVSNTLTNARNALSVADTSLADTENQLYAIASTYGLGKAARSENSINSNTEAQILASSVAETITGTPAPLVASLSADTVRNLIGESE